MPALLAQLHFPRDGAPQPAARKTGTQISVKNKRREFLCAKLILRFSKRLPAPIPRGFGHKHQPAAFVSRQHGTFPGLQPDKRKASFGICTPPFSSICTVHILRPFGTVFPYAAPQ